MCKHERAGGCVPALHVGTDELIENEDKVQALARTLRGSAHQGTSRTFLATYTELEVQRSLNVAKGSPHLVKTACRRLCRNSCEGAPRTTSRGFSPRLLA